MDCQICGEEAELLEHHVSYSGRYGLFPIEIILEVCMGCHHKIHKQRGFHDELNPVESTPESASEHEDLIARLIQDCSDINSLFEVNSSRKYRMYEGDGGWEIEPIE